MLMTSGSSCLHVVRDEEAGLNGVVAIDSTALGPAAGGCRFWRYPSQAALQNDAVRLARGMTFKNAMAGLPLGGGKSVLQVPTGPYDRVRLFEAFGAAVEALNGSYVTAEDVGTTIADMEAIRRRTKYVAGLTSRTGRAGGDPSPWTAMGVFLSLQVAAKVALGASLADLTVAVQGAGNVGSHLCRLLVEGGARVVVADIDADRCKELARSVGAAVVLPDEIARIPADVFAPCALGGALNEITVASLRAKLVCGGANNQIENTASMELMTERGIAYVPDYVANAGGIINVSAEYLGETTEQVEARVNAIPARVESIFERATAEGRPTAVVADEMAEEILRGRHTAVV